MARKIDVTCFIAVKYPHYGEVTFKEMTEDEVTWLIDLIVSMLNNSIIQDWIIM